MEVIIIVIIISIAYILYTRSLGNRYNDLNEIIENYLKRGKPVEKNELNQIKIKQIKLAKHKMINDSQDILCHEKIKKRLVDHNNRILELIADAKICNDDVELLFSTGDLLNSEYLLKSKVYLYTNIRKYYQPYQIDLDTFVERYILISKTDLEEVGEVIKSINSFKRFVSADRHHYFSHDLVEKCKKYETTYKYINDYSKALINIVPDDEVETFGRIYKNLESHAKEVNRIFVKKELKRTEDFFDNIG